MTNSDFRCGTVALIGEPNAGKSSLLNALLGCAVTITAPSAGTTREAIRGIINMAQAQIIFVDTPGMQPANNLLEKQMNREISGAVKTADVICFVIDVKNLHDGICRKLANYQNFGVPVVVVLTKIDTVTPEKVFRALDKLKVYDFVSDFVPVSSHRKIGLKELLQCLTAQLPVGSAIYEPEMYTDSTERDMAAEIIREAVINQVHDEIPAGVKVVITKYAVVDRSIEIAADIICDKANHKKIIIGKQGKLIRQIGIQARQKLEKLLNCHVVLETYVMVREGWRDQVQWLQS